MRYASCDVGTNSCRLLIAEVVDKKLLTITKKIVTTRLGQNADRSGWLHPAAMARTVDCLGQFSDEMFHRQVADRMVVCTSAVRSSYNREDFLVLAEERIGHNIEILSGEEEAYYSYIGAKRGLKLRRNPLVVDIGGGSTEFATHFRKDHFISIPVGAVRATEGNWDESLIREKIAQGIDPDWLKPTVPLVLVGGTTTTLIAMLKKMRRYDPDLVHGETLTHSQVEEMLNKLMGLNLEERKALPGLQPERADIIVKGVLIVKSIMEYLGRDHAIVSDSDLLDGMIWTMHERHTT